MTSTPFLGKALVWSHSPWMRHANSDCTTRAPSPADGLRNNLEEGPPSLPSLYYPLCMGLLQTSCKAVSSKLTLGSGVLLQTTATTAAQFTIGRFISFGMTGMTIVVVPIYLSETAPKVLRGMMTSTLQLMIIFGQVIASLVNFGTQHIPSDAGWRIPVGLQFIAPALILAFLPAVPESPRW